MDTPTTTTLAGTVLQPPQVRVLPAGKGHGPVPVLCLHIRADGITDAPVLIEQQFAPGAYCQCRAAARRIKPGTHITVEAPLAALRLTVAGRLHIETDTHTPTKDA